MVVLSKSRCYSAVSIVALIFVIMQALTISIIAWLEKLQKDNGCKCSVDWKQKWILRILSIVVIWNIANGSVLIYEMYKSQCKQTTPLYNNALTRIIHIAIMIGFIVYLVLAFSYIKMLKQKSCECAVKDTGFKIMQFHAWLTSLALIVPLVLPLIIFIGVIIYTVFKRK